MGDEQWSTVVPNTSRDDRGDIRRSKDPFLHPELGLQGELLLTIDLSRLFCLFVRSLES